MAFSHSGVVGGTGPIPPRYQRNRQKLVSLGITDNINENYYLASHYIEFCRPLPNDHFNCTVTDARPGTTDCGIFTKDLKDFPLDNLPSGGPCTSDMRISSSEMAYVYVEFDNYPAGNPITHIWTNRDTGQELFRHTVTLPPPDPSWTWWYGYMFSWIGHFSWEIVSSGNYRCEITTPYWGNALIDFVVVNTVGSLAIASTPSGARIWIDNIDKGVNTPSTVTGLAAGQHIYKLVHTGYADLTGTFTIIPESTTPVSKIVKFSPSAYFTSTPTNARITLDNVDTGIYTPATFIGLTESIHSYKLVLAPYPDIIGTFLPSAGSTAAIPATFLQGTIFQITASNMIRYSSDDVINGGGYETTYSLMKEIILTADYQGSIRIYYEDLVLYLTGSASTQIYKNEVPWGTIHDCQQFGYDFTAVSQDFTNVSLASGTRIQIYGNKTRPAFQNLTQLYVQNFRVEFDLPPGNALFTSTPVGARIWIDGVDQGIGKDTPYTITGIQPYSRNYTLKKAGYADKSGIVQIGIGLTTSVSETLLPYKEISASNVIRYSDDTSGDTSGGGTGALTKVKEIIIPDPYIGSWRIYFELGCIDLIDGCRYAGYSSRGQIYKDDVPYGTLQSTGSSEDCCSAFSEDFTNINISPGTKIELYVEYSGTADTYTVFQNFRVMFDLPVNTITISPTAVSIEVGNTQQLTAECRDEQNNVVTPILTWTSSNQTVATVNPTTGLITGISSGITDISCSSGGKTSNPSVITVILLPPEIHTITIGTPSSSVVWPNTLQLTAICKDQYNTEMDCPILTWESSNPAAATVYSNGLLESGIIPGTADITATSGLVTSNILTITVSLPPPELHTIIISTSSNSVIEQEILQLTYTCKDQYNDIITCPTLTWESRYPLKATVDSTGKVTGVSAGTTEIKATSGLITSNILTITVNIPPPTLNTIIISTLSNSVIVQETLQLTSTCKDQYNADISCPILTWESSDLTVASIDSTGLVTGILPGTTDIIATSGLITSNILTITVSQIPESGGGMMMIAAIAVAAAVIMSSKKPS